MPRAHFPPGAAAAAAELGTSSPPPPPPASDAPPLPPPPPGAPPPPPSLTAPEKLPGAADDAALGGTVRECALEDEGRVVLSLFLSRACPGGCATTCR